MDLCEKRHQASTTYTDLSGNLNKNPFLSPSDGSEAEAEAEEGLKAKGDVDASHRGVHELFSDILYSNPGEPPTQEVHKLCYRI